jgi:rhodanese-related sulfurtransferase
MPMTTSLKQMIETANAAVPKITPQQAREMMDGGALVIDVRDAPEVETTGKIAGSLHISRGMLEFRADPDSPFHDRKLTKDRTLIVYCASGGRSALAGKALKDLGFGQVFNGGAFKDWVECGGAIEKPIDRGM